MCLKITLLKIFIDSNHANCVCQVKLSEPLCDVPVIFFNVVCVSVLVSHVCTLGVQ